MTRLTFTLLILFSTLGGQSIQPVSGKTQVMAQDTKRDPVSDLEGGDLQIARSETTNLFGIYLVAEPVDRRITVGGKGDWSRLRLSESPLISAADIISYDFAEHSMRLRLEVLARIPTPPVEGTPFVVVAHGQRIYLGVFTTVASSIPSAVPSIMVHRGMLVPLHPKDTVLIERAYPSPQFGVGPDPRGDERIKTALKALKKLKSDE
jgi:hypothetical protein